MKPPRRPCGCTTYAEELDPRHIIHYDSSKPDPARDKKKEKEAFALLQKAREERRKAVLAKDHKTLDTVVRKMYKDAAIAYAHSGDIVGAVIADSEDSSIDWQIEMIVSWEDQEYKRYWEIK